MFVNDEDILYDIDEPVDEYGEPIEEPVKEPEPEPTEEPVKDEPVDEDISDPVPEEEPEPTPEPEKKVQSDEENARFAEQRRQKQLEEELQKRPEYQISKFLSEQYGMSPEELYKQMQESALQKQAEEQKVPVEVLRQQQLDREKNQQLEEKLNQLEFTNWYNSKMSEAQSVKDRYKGVIDDKDVESALDYMLSELGTTSMSLDKAVRLVHGDKIESEIRKIAKQEALAEISGRGQSPLAPQGGKPTSSDNQLTAEEKYVAQQMGLTEEEYLKYK